MSFGAFEAVLDNFYTVLSCTARVLSDAQGEEAQAIRHFESFDLTRFPREHEYDTGYRDYVDPVSIARDRRHMEQEAEEAFRYAQLLIAHRTPKDHLEIHLPAINSALDAVWVMVRTYYLLLAGERLTKHPRPPGHWREPFKEAWCPTQKHARTPEGSV